MTLKISRQCAPLQITVTNNTGVMVYEHSCSPEAPGYLEYQLKEALVHERRIIEGEIANSFHDRIAQLNKEIRELKAGKQPEVIQLQGERVVDAEFKQLTGPNYDA